MKNARDLVRKSELSYQPDEISPIVEMTEEKRYPFKLKNCCPPKKSFANIQDEKKTLGVKTKKLSSFGTR